MANNDPADHGVGEHGAEVAAMYIQHLDSLEESLLQAIKALYRNNGLANNTGAPIMLMYTVIKIVQQKLIFEMGRQDINQGSDSRTLSSPLLLDVSRAVS